MSSSTARSLPDKVVVGRVRRVHGVRGEVVVEPLSDVTRRFVVGARFELVRDGNSGHEVRVAQCRLGSRGLLVHFEGVEDRDRAQLLVGAELAVPRTKVPKARPGEYYHFQLVGCRCRDLTAGELGEVDEVIEDGGGVLLIVRSERGTLPVPFVKSFLRRVDVEAGEIEVDLPPGLVDECTST